MMRPGPNTQSDGGEWSFEHLRIDDSFADALYRSCHSGRECVGQTDEEASSGHVNRDVGCAQTEPARNGRSCRAAAPGSQGVACAALPYFDPDVLTVDDLQELNVRPFGRHPPGFFDYSSCSMLLPMVVYGKPKTASRGCVLVWLLRIRKAIPKEVCE